jgi:hypothetical protein
MGVLPRLEQDEISRYLQEWTQRLNDLYKDIRSWSQEEKWSVSESHKEITEQIIGSPYSAVVLEINTKYGTIIMEPIARFVLLAAGRVDIYAYPSMNRVKLLWDEKRQEWFVLTDSNLEWPQPWGKEAFLALAHGLHKNR